MYTTYPLGELKMRELIPDAQKARRVNISLRDTVREKAKRLGDGNVSRGIALAIRMAEENKLQARLFNE